MKTTPREPVSLRTRATQIVMSLDFWVLMLPLIFYGLSIRKEITFGDGPELLVAMATLGGPHPSGYPLITLLGSVVTLLPGHIFWNVAFAVSAIPGAIAVWLMYRFLLEFHVGKFPSAITALAYGFSWNVAYQATRIEVYSLHCMLMLASMVCLAKFWRPVRPVIPQPPPDIRWAYGAVLFSCLALTNHLTSVFLVVPVVLGLLLADWRRVVRPRTVAIFCGIALACASIYLYLPLQASLNTGDRVSWNDPLTLERFWFHVSGKEYSIFRTTDLSKVQETGEKILRSINNSYFPGILIVCLIGAVDWLLRHPRSFVTMVVFFVPSLLYVSTYNISDIATYFTGLFIPLLFAFAFGLDWLLKMRFRADLHKTKLSRVVHLAVVLTMVGWLIGMLYYGRTHHYREALAIDMSNSVMSIMEDPAVIFTSVDGHTFPMWYQVYIGQPDRKVAVVDTVMINLKNKQWYRDHLRRSYPWVNFPDDETLLKSGWRQWIINNNSDLNFYALLQRQWPETRSYPVNRGWFFEIVNGRRGKAERGERKARHIYIARQAPVKGNYFHDSRYTYKVGEERIACVVEWWKHKGFVGKWRITGPNGELHEWNNHDIPENSNLSWEYLRPEQQSVGKWKCEVDAPNNPTLVVEFEFVE